MSLFWFNLKVRKRKYSFSCWDIFIYCFNGKYETGKPEKFANLVENVSRNKY